MDSEKLELIRKRCENAAKEPWISYIEDRDHTCGSNFIQTPESDIELINVSAADQDFIAHARKDILLLLDEINNLKLNHESEFVNPIVSSGELELITERCAKASKGAWLSINSNFIEINGNKVELTGASAADMDFIVHAREDVLLLLKEIHNLSG